MSARPRCGFGLIELIVALTIIAIGVLGLTAAALVAQRSFISAQTIESAARAAAVVIDSLTNVDRPASGERVEQGVRLRWTVSEEAGATLITTTVHIEDRGHLRELVYHTSVPVP